MKKHWIFCTAVAALLACSVGCPPSGADNGGSGGGASGGGGSGSDAKVIKIVSSLPRTGSAKGQTDTIVNGIKMAIDEAGAEAGGFSIVYEDLDDATAAAGQWTAEAEGTNAKKAVANADVMAFIGPYNSGAAMISMPILNEADLLQISPSNTWPGLTKEDVGAPDEPAKYRPTSRVNFLRVCPTDDLQGKVAAEWSKSMGVEKVYILDDGELYGKGIADMFEESCKDLGLEVLGRDSIDPKAQEFRSLMTTIKSKGPGLVYFGGTTQSKGGQIAKDMVAAGLDAKLMAPDGCYEQAFIESAGADNLNGRCFITFGGIPPEEQVGPGKEFVDKYKEKYGAMPEAYAIYAYEATKVALQAIEDAGVKDRRAITDAALAIRDFDGALGTWSFDDNGDTSLTRMSGIEVTGGEFKFVKFLGE
ncbi:MAG: branched-chain amino acid ABC transporter substrate-binding protein [Planctomycetales bacterium]|nr:branched-chain amino acid ABC transporter substrate-binding protein [Planctomycetales bacterium]